MLQMVRSWVESEDAPSWTACAGLAPELRCWPLQIGNLKVDSLGRLWRRRSPPSVGSQLVVPVQKRQDLINQFHDSIFAGHLGITRTVFPPTGQILLARPTQRRSNIHKIVHDLHSTEVTLPTEGADGTCRSGP